ncbi:expressed unknown protein [Seminavis robusta]|uniref:Uncharacterized protein n=1 Tax=Seminavis robusta TaxID=568900 RepID=A0A9N8EXT1_9STRA|nr:expressed unknown protein [Seminavis robusta]|eukprot:Sro2022_g311470.1 n/a (148) ;mRNA; r:1078-1521
MHVITTLTHLLPPPPHHHHHRHHHRHHPSAHYSSHAIVPLFVTEPPVSRTHSIGSVVSFDDGSCPAAPKPFEGIPMPPLYVKPEKLFVKNNEDFELPVPTVSPSMAADKPIVEPDVAVLGSVPDRSPTKEETAIDAMLSLRSASFGV